ncbi:MAG: hypothetical protein LKG19_15845 [Saprospiraceae bacterium]|jgi:hypothetical protein|nr:hypothetical protein [Saprospiraceae bacterium]
MKMYGIIGLLMALVMLSSCRKDLDLFSNGFTTVSEDYTTQQDILESNETEISEQIENGLLAVSSRSFPTRTWSNPKGTYPNILTIDYGTTGVTGPYGRVRRGKLIIQISAPLNIPGSVRTVSHDQFYIDDVKVDGTVTLINQGLNTKGQNTFLRNVSNRVLSFPSGKSISWNATQYITQLEGLNTPLIKLDDVYSTSGTSEGVNREGKPFSVNTSEPLITKFTCAYIVDGFITVTFDLKTVSIDYGDGICNNTATLILSDGSTREISIRRWW